MHPNRCVHCVVLNHRITAGHAQITVEAKVPDGTTYRKQWNLFGAVDEASMKVRVTAFKIEIELLVLLCTGAATLPRADRTD